MRLDRFDEFLNEAKKTKKVDYIQKFGKKVDEINELIAQAKKDDVYAVETEGTWESVYEFDKVVITPTMLKVSYNEDYKPKKKVEKISFAKDKENGFEETKYMFSWIKKTIKKGYRVAAREQKKQEKEDNE